MVVTSLMESVLDSADSEQKMLTNNVQLSLKIVENVLSCASKLRFL